MNIEEEKFRKAVKELRDSYELHLRRWAERCLQDIEIAYEKEKEKNKKAIDFINNENNYFEDGENWQNILKIKEILEE